MKLRVTLESCSMISTGNSPACDGGLRPPAVRRGQVGWQGHVRLMEAGRALVEVPFPWVNALVARVQLPGCKVFRLGQLPAGSRSCLHTILQQPGRPDSVAWQYCNCLNQQVSGADACKLRSL
jgi:hypothetical protein